MNKIKRDDTEHGVEYVRADEAMAEIERLKAAQPAPVQEPVALDGQRRLVEILAENWRVWPARKAVEQTSLGDVYCSAKGRGLMFGNHEIAADQDSAVVTKEMWGTMRQTLAAQPAVPLTDENIDRIAYALTGFDGDGTQAMNIDEIRRIARAAARLTAAPEKGGAA